MNKLFALISLLLVSGASVAQENIYDTTRSYSSGTSFLYPAPDGTRAQRVAGVEFIAAKHSQYPYIKADMIYRNMCWGALPVSSVRVAAGNIYVIPSGEPLQKCWHKAPKSARAFTGGDVKDAKGNN